MMEQILIRILNMSLTAGVAILAVLFIRIFLRKAPKIFSYALWLVVLFRLLCPFSFSSSLSLFRLLQVSEAEGGQMHYIPDNIGLMEQPAVHLPVPAMDDTVNASLPAAVPYASVNPMQIILFIGAYIWLFGIMVMLIYSAASYVRLRKKLKTAVWERDNIYIMQDINWQGVGTPFVCGLFSPLIYLPAALEEKEKEYILLHEQIHIKRKDHIFRMVSFLALCIHWFNPLVWLAFFVSGKDMEMSCDEAVIRKLGSSVKKEYTASLLSLASGRRIVLDIPLAFGEGETGGRIRNVLRYRKPAWIAVCTIVIVCMAAMIALAANPRQRGGDSDEQALHEGETAVVYYGVVSDIDIEGIRREVVIIPGLGDMEIPEAAEVYPYIEIEHFAGPKSGDLLEITFPEGEEVMIQEIYPATFSTAARSVIIMGEGFRLSRTNSGSYLFTVPWGLAREAKAGDRIEIYYPNIETEGKDRILLAAAPVLSVDSSQYHIWVELSVEELKTFLAEFGHGITCEIIPQDRELEPQHLLDGQIKDGVYRVHVRSLSSSAKGIDKYLVDGIGWEENLPFLAFADNCRFSVNQAMEYPDYVEADITEFADLVREACSYLNPPLLLSFEDGFITDAVLENYYGSGISYEKMQPGLGNTDFQELIGPDGDGILSAYYTLQDTEQMDIGDSEGLEKIEVYTGNIGDGDSGYVLFWDGEGNLLHTESAHVSRAGWNSIYLGERGGTDFIMTLHMEDRDTYGEYAYHVFRLSETGGIRQIAGSSFTFEDGRIPYDDTLFQEWADKLEGYLRDSHLILSTQDGVLLTTHVSQAEKYCYETLKRE